MEGTYEQMVDMGVTHLRDFIAFVERIVGKKMDWDRLNQTVDLMIEINRIWHEANELRKVKPCPMHSRDFWSAMTPALFLMGDLKDTLASYRDVYNEVKQRADN